MVHAFKYANPSHLKYSISGLTLVCISCSHCNFTDLTAKIYSMLDSSGKHLVYQRSYLTTCGSVNLGEVGGRGEVEGK